VGHSDAIELYAGRELPYRGREDASLRRKALEVLESTDVVMACHREGAPQLHDVCETDDPDHVREWFEAPHLGELLVGPHPLLRHDRFSPETRDAFLASAPLPDGAVVPGAY
jgi:hypothetical protein